MAGVEKREEKLASENNSVASHNEEIQATEEGHENVCIVPSSESNEILLYVSDGNAQGVQDLLRVALNQPSLVGTTTNLSDIKDGEAKLVGEIQGTEGGHTIISVPVSSIASGLGPTAEGGIIQTDHSEHQVVQVQIQQSDPSTIDTKTQLFQLADLTHNLNADEVEQVTAQVGVVHHGVELDATEVLKSEADALMGDFIIANVDAAENEKIPGELNIGDSFYCLEDLEESLRLYEEKNGIKLYKRDVRSLEALLKRSLKLQKLDKINERLKYGQLLYCCVYGGKRKAQKIACMDESGLARYTDCKMFIRFAISDDGMKLVVNGKFETHNHVEVVTNEQEPEAQYFSNTGNASEVRLGAGFVDLEELYKAINKYETDNHVHLWRRDGRTVEALAKRAPGTARKIMETNPGLRFAELRFCCSYGGRQSAEERKDKKNPQNTFKQGCEMHIRFGVSEDGSQLVVKSMSEEHNHEINEETIVKEALHPDLCVYVSKLVWQDLHISIDDVKAKLEDYVLSVMFKGQQPPPRTRRQYFPSKKQVRYFMAKAKTSLNISPEAQQKLESLMERLKEARSDEKMVSNFHVQNVMSGFDLNNEESMEEDAASQSLGGLNEQNAKLLFCHQTPQQQRLMRRYNTQVIMTQISDLHSKIPFPLFCLYVQTNVDFQLVGEFICQANDHIMIEEGLQTIKEWNPGWNPKFVVVDFEDQQITAVENAFQGAFALVSDASREKAWHEWLDMESNGVVEFKEDVMKYLDAIAFSYSEETLNKAARELEESDVWKMSDKMRNWFQLNWLAQAKRWVAGYRPDDYLMAIHNDRTLSDELKMFKSIKLANKSAPLNDLIQQLIEHIVPVSKKQYELLNKDSFRLQNELYYIYPDIPNYLSNRPGKLTKHIYERLKIASTRNYYITEIHPGIFSVQGCEEPDDQLHTISYGDTTSYPSCDCEDWQRFKLPCVHLAAIFNSYPDWTWDMMSVPYRTNPIFQADWSVVSQDIRTDAPGLLIDVGTQTTGATLLPAYTPEFSLTRMNDSRRPAETPQVLANQCRGLLQQISKLQLAHHTRDSLYRLRSELKELVSIFSTAPKTKVVFPISSIPLSNKSRKQSGAQTVFEQYNVKLVTPKQVALSGKVSETTTVHTTEAVVSSHHHQHQTQQEMESDGDEVDGMYISTVSEEQIIEDQTTETLAHIPANTTSTTSTTTRKRVQSPSPFFKQQPSEKKTRLMTEDEILAASQSIAVKTTDPTENVLNATEMQFPANATLSTVIDGQTINISLDQVAAAMNNAKMATNAVEEAGDGGHSQEILTFTTNSSADISDESGAHVVENLVVAEDAGMVVAEETENENETISQQDQIKTDDESVK
uniref:SWIM-type domain-containing protein n=2 Tax=Clytia hemisphaerica TaxID=252671 RepID=A0A7M5X082_9CNID